MKFGSDNFGHAHAAAGYANAPARVPFVELVEPFLYIGEEIVRFAMAAARATARAANAVTRWRNQRATRKALQALEDHRLDDIGVRREDIAELARELAHG